MARLKNALQGKTKKHSDEDWGFTYEGGSKKFRPVPSHEKVIRIDHEMNPEAREKIRKMAEKELGYFVKKYGFEKEVKDRIPSWDTDKFKKERSADFGTDCAFDKTVQTMIEEDKPFTSDHRVPIVWKMLHDGLHNSTGEDSEVFINIVAKNDKRLMSIMTEVMGKEFHKKLRNIEKSLDDYPPRVLGSLVVFFLKCLPGTLFTREYVDYFYQLIKINDKSDQLKAMKLLTFQLPDVNCNLFIDLIKLLEKFANGKDEAATNKLIIPITHVLFDCLNPEESDKKLELRSIISLTQLMVNCADILFSVPPFMLHALKSKLKDDKDEERLKYALEYRNVIRIFKP